MHLAQLVVEALPYTMPTSDAMSIHKSIRRCPMKLSARNVLKGKIIEVKKGSTTAHVRIQLTGGPWSPPRSRMKASTSYT
jgi:ABC-type molybdate transport system ATPase subunit